MSNLFQICKRLLYFLLCFCFVRLCENKVNLCSYQLSHDDDSLTFKGKFYTARSKKYAAYMNLCNELPKQYCGPGYKLCIKDSENDTDFIAGNELITEYINSNISSTNTLYLNGINATLCHKLGKNPKVVIKFLCDSDKKDEPTLIVKDKCDFEIQLLHPTSCVPKCALKVYDHIIDLRSLRKVYHVHDDLGNFSIGFCTTNPECHESNTFSCLITENDTIPLSGALETLQYYDDSNTIKLRGKFKGRIRNDEKMVEIVVKCDWNKSEPELLWVKPAHHSKTFHFEMVTSRSCVKYNLPPQFKNGRLIYDLAPLQNIKNYYKINTTEGNIFINVFGILKLPDQNNDCSKTFAQICLRKGSQYINLGSIQLEPTFEEDVIYIHFKNGKKCTQNTNNDTYQQYETTIEFVCGYDISIRLIEILNCHARIQWVTPAVCPKYDKSICSDSHPSDSHCTLEFSNKLYNLTSLYNTNGKYIIGDTKEKIQYILNICGPVIDDDVHCTDSNSAFLKQISEPDIKKRTVGLGKMTDLFVENDYLVMKLSSGGFCDLHDYESFIYFVCSDKEKQPELKNRTNCRVDFIWITPAACPISKASNTHSKCIFDENVAEKIDLSGLSERHKYFETSISGITYMFDICSTNKIQPKNDKTIYIAAQKNVFIHGSKKYIAFFLGKPCNSRYDFNKTLMELACDRLQNNDHYSSPIITECTLTLTLSSHLVCRQQDDSFYTYDVHDNDERDVSSEITYKSCSIKNPKTDYKFNIQKLMLKFPTNFCPEISFNYTKKFTELKYKTDHVCDSQRDRTKVFNYKVLLSCSDHSSHTIQRSVCTEEHLFEDKEYCKLLEDGNTSLIWPWVIGGLFIIVLSIVAVWLCYNYLYKKWQDYKYICSYEKNSDE